MFARSQLDYSASFFLPHVSLLEIFRDERWFYSTKYHIFPFFRYLLCSTSTFSTFHIEIFKGSTKFSVAQTAGMDMTKIWKIEEGFGLLHVLIVIFIM